jgi:hypothetical protein
VAPESATALPLADPLVDSDVTETGERADPGEPGVLGDDAAEPEAAKVERPLTTFHVLTTADGGNLWKYQGTIEARDRAHAERLFFEDLPVPEGGITHSFVTGAAWQPATRIAEVTGKTKTEPFTMPEGGALT